MKNSRKILLGTGIALLIAGVAGAGITYQDIRRENLMHAVAATVPVPFADTAASLSAGFLPYRDGTYSLYLSAPGDPEDPGRGPGQRNAAACPPEAVLAGIIEYDGSLEIAVTDPDGRVTYSRRITPGNVPATLPTGRGWVLIDTLGVPAGGRQWTLGVSVRPGDTHPPVCGMDIFLLPPQRHDIGSYMAGGVMWLVGFGGCMMLGFIVIVLAGRAGR